ncbi:hypothetical protein SAMN02745202_00599 [Segatella oulorum]|uniref:Uncharacterized protein n=1 Tax=Segatella oulorum TaxID=28136 RepID=A0A1T4M260_9BACT|nr:hypothetical protein SAMN02745202_00599 [Segatella oulorum]
MEFLPTDLKRQEFHMEFLPNDLGRQDFHLKFYQLTSSVKISTWNS